MIGYAEWSIRQQEGNVIMKVRMRRTGQKGEPLAKRTQTFRRLLKGRSLPVGFLRGLNLMKLPTALS